MHLKEVFLHHFQTSVSALVPATFKSFQTTLPFLDASTKATKWSTEESFVTFCNNSYLKLSISKTKELVVNYQRNRRAPVPVIIQGEEMESVDSYRYLGAKINKKLNWCLKGIFLIF